MPRKVRKCNCGKSPSYGYKNQKTPTHCISCKDDKMIDIKHRKCKCGKNATFGFEKPVTHCSKCKEDGMKNFHEKKCKCGKIASFGFKKPATHCSKCKEDGMKNLKINYCKCGTTASFGLNKKRTHCSKCKEDGMKNLKINYCKCGLNQASFGLNKKRTHCSKCKEDGMKYISIRTCKCGKRACFNYLNKSPRYCVECKKEDMDNIVIKRCKSEFCDTKVGNYGKKYDGYCVHCFCNLFPEDIRTTKAFHKSKELKVVSYISNKIEGFIHDKPLYVDIKGGCCNTKRRIDLRKLINNTMLCIEIDENEHKNYNKEDENNRYDNLFMDFSGKYIFIRYNPDKYKIKNITKNPKFETRMNILIDQIEKQIKRIHNEENKELIEIIYLFFSV